MKQGRVKQEYRKVSQGLDKVLKAHGYERKDKYYKAVNANKDTIVFFCHFGVECVMLSHLLNISPVCLWQGFCAAPTSVTTLYTEEREKGIAVWRCSSFGDISHLYAGNEEPAFAARFAKSTTICRKDTDKSYKNGAVKISRFYNPVLYCILS